MRKALRRHKNGIDIFNMNGLNHAGSRNQAKGNPARAAELFDIPGGERQGRNGLVVYWTE